MMRPDALDVSRLAGRALERMLRAGFDDALVTASVIRQQELNFALNHPEMLRSTELHTLSLWGLVDGRKASTELSDLGEEALEARLPGLLADARSAPQDEANAVSAQQQARIDQGPLTADLDALADTVSALLDHRAARTPRVILQEGAASHTLQHSHTLSSRGSELSAQAGWYSLSWLGTARDAGRASSFNMVYGECHDLTQRPVAEWFGIGPMLHDMEAQVHAQPLGAKFEGEVILTPRAVQDLVQWLLGQLGDVPLITGSSPYRDRVGEQVASPLLSLRSLVGAPGALPLSADGFPSAETEVLAAGRLMTLTPSLYGSRKTGRPHCPVSADGGWSLAAGATPLAQMVRSVHRGAIVGRLSMGTPAAGGEFAGVIKNSFLVENGVRGPALSEAMISGNVARMLEQVVAVSAEHIDTGCWDLPWLQVRGLHFS